MNERNKPKTLVVEGRVDMRDLSTIAKYLDSENNLPRTKSGLVSQIISDFAELLVNNKLIARTTSTLDALRDLEQLGFEMGGPSRNGKRNRRSYLKQIQLETLGHEEQVLPDFDSVDDTAVDDELEKMKSYNKKLKK